MTAKMTGFTVEGNGDVYLLVDLGAGAHRVLISSTMLAGIAEASAEMVRSGVFAETPASEPRQTGLDYCQTHNSECDPDYVRDGKVHYVQVATPQGKVLTYSSDRYVRPGSSVVLPPLPWMSHNWSAVVISDERGDYDGKILPVIAASR